ncbi:MAG: restriction endonuclease subunit S [Furfurilactobacillus sp.]|jgi:type I restriction enzyme S subunit|uniref:restriction endonuclease subunit S n=1 Tax=Furfurilactobacillus sp. TaxID=2767911 RepID=UPI00258989BD|nr:restriction endonuclease subunit S [Furfurilactobacillus sp.]MCH4012090.1 restriction endonuclease subunit S [Furfurilactobacillus sp.]MCH4037982.1 restriction endonuclease subunit S [Furfurilactobacillus sp.]MCH4115381.1 restriction endonuclease subunit S [Furfurilactobacillus sp.]MCI1340602.1 restriction endonuclease subunit S [Furfurilactobacillus sp.]MCI1387678.1 restriction endonuclease subunit S [Furfurilactobacillus sp.]
MGKLGKFQAIVTWEQRKLGELGTLRRGKSKHRPRNDPKLFGGDYPFIQTGDVSSSGLYLHNFTQTLNDFGLAQSKLWNKGTLVITIAANVADSAILAIDAAFPDSVIGFTSETSSVEFAKFLLDELSDGLKRTAPTGSQANLNLEILSNTSEYVPAISEQRQIARLLIQFEKIIALHERKLELMKVLKKAYLQQLFPKNGDKTPHLRFAGFSDDWEQRKFKTLYNKVTEKNDLTISKNRVISVAQMKWGKVPQNSTNKYMRSYNVIRIGDIAFEGNRSKNFAFGRFVENTLGTGLVSHVFDVFRPTNNIDLDFWKYYIHDEEVMRNILRKSTQKSTMMTNLVSKDFMRQQISISEPKEQHEIGNFIKMLDKAIDLNECKVEQLILLKRTFLQKIFV